jgi:ABC-type sugar transport system permease subunit
MPALCIANAWTSYPLVMVLILAALQTIPTELTDAARIDGATYWQRFRFVTLPLLRQSTLVAAVLTTLHAFNNVTLVLVMTGGGPAGTTETFALRIFQEAFSFYRLGLAAAGAVIVLVLNVVFNVSYRNILREQVA